MNTLNQEQLASAIEAVLFAAGEPMSVQDLRQVFDRLWAERPAEELGALKKELDGAVGLLRERWRSIDGERGFQLIEVADGMTLRTNPRFADVLKAMREARPVRLSRAALETLAIIAYRQPVTKPEIDHLRGVDCTATIKLLLDRTLVRIVGKKEEPGLPLLYGTTREFLSFFNLSNLAQLPSLREYHELTEESQEELAALDGQPPLESLRDGATPLRPDEEPAVLDLDAAVAALKSTEKHARASLAEHGIQLVEEEGETAGSTPAQDTLAPDTSADPEPPLSGA